MKKRLISAMLAICMLLSSTATGFAIEDASGETAAPESQETVLVEEELTETELPEVELPEEELPEEEQPEEDPALQAYLDSLEPFTMESVNPYTPSAVKNLLTAGEIDHAYEREAAADEPDASSYVPGEVLFAYREGGISLFSANDIEAELSALGVTGAEKIMDVADNSGGITLFSSEQTVWYQAEITGDVLETVKALESVYGIVAAEPNYIYTTGAYQEPSEAEQNANWSFSKAHDKSPDSGNHTGWWKDRNPLPGEETPADINPGYGTVVAVIDTGVDYTHNDLAANMWVNPGEIPDNGIDDDNNGYIDDVYGVNMLASGKKAGDPQDDHGHGTHVAGIIAMSANGEGGVGIAWGAKIMAIKAGQSTGTLTSSNIAKAIKYAHQMGADVINMSFGGTEESYLVEQALSAAFADCVLVASAGNNGKTTTDAIAYGFPPNKVEDIYPAGYTYVLGVMATDASGSKAGFSNWDFINNGGSAEYELTAPGVDIYSTLPGNRYGTWSGTSMAAPQVAAAAAILRSHFSDKDMYSTRFIYGQLASATEDSTFYYGRSYAALNIEDSCTRLPKPNLKVTDVFALDNKNLDPANDEDAIVDAGEVINLGVAIRNQWGQTGDIKVSASAVSEGGVVNPYLDWIIDEIKIDPAGTYAEQDNGFVREDSELTAVSNPLQFRVKADTPNDTEIAIDLTVTTKNGVDDSDDATYTAKKTFTFRVVSGKGIRGIITEDITLDNAHYWIIENTVLVEEGVTLTVEPGTQIQFWSSDYEDAYGGKTMAAIINAGTLNMIGTEDAPISMFPGDGFSDYVVEIAGDGVETLKYCEIENPRLGYTGITSNPKRVDTVDHCRLTQNQKQNITRYLNGATVADDKMYPTFYSSYGFSVKTLSNSALSGFCGNSNRRELYIGTADCNSYNDCHIQLASLGSETDSVYMVGDHRDAIEPSSLSGATWVPNIRSIDYDETIYHCEAAGSRYVFLDTLPSTYYVFSYRRELVRALLDELDGTLLCLGSEEEETFILNTLRAQAEAERMPDMTSGIQKDIYLGYSYDAENDSWGWEDGNSYTVASIQVIMSANRKTAPYGYLQYSSYPSSVSKYLQNTSNTDSFRYVLEVPDTLSDAEIKAVLDGFDYEQWFFDHCAPKLTNSAILNPVLNDNPDTWAVVTAPSYNKDIRCYNLTGNYWGTESSRLINKMINDADDFAGTLGDIVEEPILTLDSASLADIYPFVTAVWLEDSDGNIVSSVTPGATYEVHVTYNRDMAQDVPPTVTYGPATPYTDFSVRGDWVSDREWVGTTTVSPVMTAGTQYFKTSGGCAAEDNWLVCGNDILRFQFEVSTTGVLAMMLQASGGANQINLSWAQNDYDTLAGYNLYRSTQPDSGFTKLNDTIITGLSYVDQTVAPGVTYYYYFKVVNTDGVEEATVSNTASAAAIDNVKPTLTHTRVTSAKTNTSVTLSANATDNIAVTAVKAYYRITGTEAYTELSMIAGDGNRYVATIPASAVTAAGVDYYIAASDGDGNTTYSGTAIAPNHIAVNSNPYISGIVPGTVSVAGGTTVTILGGNFTEGMTLKVGGVAVASYSLIDAGQITFLAPAKAIGSYAVTLTTQNGLTVSAPTLLAYADEACTVQIPTNMDMTAAVQATIPVYVSISGELTDFEMTLDLPSASFANVTVEKADSDAAFSPVSNYKNGKLMISCASSGDINPGAGNALLYIKLTPKAVLAESVVELTLSGVSCNGAAISNLVSGTATISPNFSLNALVQYFKNSKPVDGVTISADSITAQTSEAGQAALTGIKRADVTVIASKAQYVANEITAFDASLILQHTVELTELDASQLIAADVDGNGKVNAHDASLILQFAVGKIDAFAAGSWKFTPASKTMTLTANTNSVTFTAILIGDVDGSWESAQ